MNAVEAVVRKYFDGLYNGDVGMLRSVFHGHSHLYAQDDGQLIDLPLEDWLARVAGRPSPASQAAAREDVILHLELSDPGTALAKVSCLIPPRRFVDYLTLLRVEGEWRIISKTYQSSPL